MNVSKKLMKAISDLCWNDQSRYQEFKIKLEERLSSRAGQGMGNVKSSMKTCASHLGLRPKPRGLPLRSITA